MEAEGIIPKPEPERIPTPDSLRPFSPSQRLFLRDIDSNTPGAVPSPATTPSKVEVKKDIAIRELMVGGRIIVVVSVVEIDRPFP